MSINEEPPIDIDEYEAWLKRLSDEEFLVVLSLHHQHDRLLRKELIWRKENEVFKGHKK